MTKFKSIVSKHLIKFWKQISMSRTSRSKRPLLMDNCRFHIYLFFKLSSVQASGITCMRRHCFRVFPKCLLPCIAWFLTKMSDQNNFDILKKRECIEIQTSIIFFTQNTLPITVLSSFPFSNKHTGKWQS